MDLISSLRKRIRGSNEPCDHEFEEITRYGTSSFEFDDNGEMYVLVGSATINRCTNCFHQEIIDESIERQYLSIERIEEVEE